MTLDARKKYVVFLTLLTDSARAVTRHFGHYNRYFVF